MSRNIQVVRKLVGHLKGLYIAICLSRSKNDAQILNSSLEATKCVQCLQCNECIGSEFRLIVQPRNYNLRKLSSIISNAKRGRNGTIRKV
jgi:hypothetical protein